jgi:hypothetical protein
MSTMIEAAFWSLLMPAVSLAALVEAGRPATTDRAVTLSAIAVRADEEESAAQCSTAEALAETIFRARWHRMSPPGGQPTPLDAKIKSTNLLAASCDGG